MSSPRRGGGLDSYRRSSIGNSAGGILRAAASTATAAAVSAASAASSAIVGSGSGSGSADCAGGPAPPSTPTAASIPRRSDSSRSQCHARPASPPPVQAPAFPSRRRRRGYDPVARCQELESELVKLKFERAAFLGDDDVAALDNRKDAQELMRLRDRLEGLREDVDGYVSDSDDNDTTDDSGSGSNLPKGKRPDHSGGLRGQKSTLLVSIEQLGRDRLEIQSNLNRVRTEAEPVRTALHKERSDMAKTQDDYRQSKDRERELDENVVQIKKRAVERTRHRVEIQMRLDRAENEVIRATADITTIRSEMTALQHRTREAAEEAQRLSSEAERIRRGNDRKKERILMATGDPDEARRWRETRKVRRKSLEKGDGNNPLGGLLRRRMSLPKISREESSSSAAEAVAAPFFTDNRK